MAYLGKTYNEKDLPKDDGFDPVPSGVYTAVVKETDIKDTKDETGRYINIRWDITGPNHKGRVVFDKIHIINKNPAAVEIAQKQLGSLLQATGIPRVQDTDELVGASCQIKVTVTKPTKDFPASNEIKGYKALEGGSIPRTAAASNRFTPPVQQPQAAVPQQQMPVPGTAAPAAQESTPPWERS